MVLYIVLAECNKGPALLKGQSGTFSENTTKATKM